MFGCEDIFDKTDEYLDGGLSEVEYALFEEHLAVCEECRKNVEFAKKLNSVMSGMPSVEPPADFLQQLHSKIESEGKTVRFYRKWQPYGALAACVLLAVVIRTNAVRNLNETSDYLQYASPTPTGYSQNTKTAEDSASVNGAAQSVTEENTVVSDAALAEEKTAVVADEKTENDVSAVKPEKRSESTQPPVKAVQRETADNAVKESVPQQSSAPTVQYSEEQRDNGIAADYGSAVTSVPDADISADTVTPTDNNDANENSAPMVYSAVPQVSSAAAPQQSENAENVPEKKKSSGGGGSSSGGSIMAASLGASVSANIIDAVHKDEVLKIVSELGIKRNGNEYTASVNAYKQFVEKLSEKGISFDGICTYEGNNVRFVIEWE